MPALIGLTALVMALIGVPLLVRNLAPSTGSASFDGESLPPVPPPPPKLPMLALVSSRAYLNPTGGFWNIEGEVRNLTREALINLQVVSTWFDPQGTLITSHADLVDLKQLMPGETSTFRSTTRARSEMSTFRLEFQSGVGIPLLTRDGSLDP